MYFNSTIEGDPTFGRFSGDLQLNIWSPVTCGVSAARGSFAKIPVLLEAFWTLLRHTILFISTLHHYIRLLVHGSQKFVRSLAAPAGCTAWLWVIFVGCWSSAPHHSPSTLSDSLGSPMEESESELLSFEIALLLQRRHTMIRYNFWLSIFDSLATKNTADCSHLKVWFFPSPDRRLFATPKNIIKKRIIKGKEDLWPCFFPGPRPQFEFKCLGGGNNQPSSADARSSSRPTAPAKSSTFQVPGLPHQQKKISALPLEQ